MRDKLKSITSKKVFIYIKKQALIGVLFGLMLIFTLINSKFLTVRNLMNIVTQNAALIIASIGVALVMISGGTDLSIGQGMSLIGVCTAMMIKQLNFPIVIAVGGGLIIGIALGAFNGFVSNKLSIHPMIVTLATMTIFQGLSYIISKSETVYDFPEAFKMIGQERLFGIIPIPVIIVAIVALIIGFVLKKTYFGRYIYAVGGNPEAARLAGIEVKKIKLAVFMIAGLLSGIAAIVMISRAGAANSTMGPGTEFNAITACVLGGISFIGGEGDVKGVVVGALILGVLSNGMQLAGLDNYYQFVVKGLILLGAIGFDTYQKQAKVKKITSKLIKIEKVD